jgi:hypothetical protein
MSPRKYDTTAEMNDTTVACTWRSDRLPRMMEFRVAGWSSSPTLAAVPSLADRFISRLPFRLRMTGIMIISWSTSFTARQRSMKIKVGEEQAANSAGTHRNVLKQLACK